GGGKRGGGNHREKRLRKETRDRLRSPDTTETPRPPPPDTRPDTNDPVEQEVDKIRGGRSAEWKVRLQTDTTEYEVKVWNLATENWSIDYSYLRGLGKLIGANDHYHIFSAIKYVTAPTGKRMTGGWMDLIISFKSNAPPNLRNRKIQVLVLPREVEQVTTHVRLIASSDQTMDLPTFREILDGVLNDPSQVASFFVYGPID
nr:hypothetical protein [Chloroflexota bacterium]